MMKLLPGMTFLCISDLVVEGNRCFKSGNIYRCTSVGSFTNDLGVRHYWGSYYDGELEENTFFRYFKPVSSNKKKYYEAKNDYDLRDDSNVSLGL